MNRQIGKSYNVFVPRHTGFASLPLHGGKDGTPFPVDRETYEHTIEVFDKALNRAAIDRSEKVKAFRTLAAFGRDDS
jgi:hypothetical protein